MDSATEQKLGALPGIISAALHRSKDGTRVVDYAQWKNAENWENLCRIGRESWFHECQSTPDRTRTYLKFVTCWTKPMSKTGNQLCEPI